LVFESHYTHHNDDFARFVHVDLHAKSVLLHFEPVHVIYLYKNLLGNF